MKRVASLAVFLSLACGSQLAAQTALLAPADISPFNVGSPSGQVLLADLNKDGHLDLLTRHQQTRTIRVHLGDGQARFTTATAAVTLTFAPAAMRLGDVNGDKILDLLVTAGARDLVDVLLGNANAVFTRARGSPFAASQRTYRYNKRDLILSTSTGMEASTSSQRIVAVSSRFRSCSETGVDDLPAGRC
jgi:hypothetical protein